MCEINIKMELFEESEISIELDKQLRDFLCESFPPDKEQFSRSRYWHGVKPTFTLTCRKQGLLVGHVGIVQRKILCNSSSIMIAGIQSLAVSPNCRGEGIGRLLMEKTMEEAVSRDIPYGMLLCKGSLEEFYNSMGWSRIDTKVTIKSEDGDSVSLLDRHIVMVLELIGKKFPLGDLDLQGRDW